MNTLPELFGERALPTHEFANWVNYEKSMKMPKGWNEVDAWNLLMKYIRFASQLFREDMLIRPDEPNGDYWVTRINPDGSDYIENQHEYEAALEAHRNWQPIFEEN